VTKVQHKINASPKTASVFFLYFAQNAFRYQDLRLQRKQFIPIFYRKEYINIYSSTIALGNSGSSHLFSAAPIPLKLLTINDLIVIYRFNK